MNTLIQLPIKLFAITLIALSLSSCGGGSGGGGNTDLQGRFKDANVDGLSYTGGLPIDGARITKDGGRFNYQTGNTLTFSIGGIPLGTAIGRATITPTDLVANGHLGIGRVTKISQLLQTLDSDGDPNNGITIVPAVVTALGTNTAAVIMLNKEVNDTFIQLQITTGKPLDMIKDIAMAAHTTGTYTVRPPNPARGHLKSTLECAYSGAYQSSATYLSESESVTVKRGLLIPAGATPTFFSNGDTKRQTATAAINFSNSPLMVGFSDAGQYTINADGIRPRDDIYTVNSGTGTTASVTIRFDRVGGDQDARYRFSGSTTGSNDDDRYLATIDVEAAPAGTRTHAVTVTTYNVGNADVGVVEEYLGTVTLSSGAGSFDIKTDSGTITATINTTTGTASGSFVEQESGESSKSINYSGTGCTLN